MSQIYFGNPNSSSPDVTVTLTGQLLTTAQGEAANENANTIFGESLAVDYGSVSAENIGALSGQSVAVGQNSLALDNSSPVTGQNLICDEGIVTGTNSVSVTLSGQSVSTDAGSLSKSCDAALSGQTLLVDGGRFVASESFAEWLVNPESIRCVIVEAVANVLGSSTTRYLSTKNYADSVGGRIYDPIVNADSVQLIERMSLDNSPSMSFGDIEIYNIDGALDSWLTSDIWVNKSITVLVGDVRWLRADFETIFSGTIEDIDSRSRDTLNIKVRDKLQRLNRPLYESLLGGTSVNKNELKPLCFGECFNVSPLLINSSTLTYKIHYLNAERIIEVRDSGVPVSKTDNLTSGEFTLSAQPFGEVTASVQGDNAAGFNTTVNDIIQRIVTGFGGTNHFVTADLDTVQLAAFDAANTQPIGVYLTQRENQLSVCNQIAASVGAQLVMSRLGKLQLLKIELPASGTAFAIDINDIIENSLSISQKLPVKGAIKINYDKNWTTQEGLQTGIPQEHKDYYALEWMSVLSSDATVKTNYTLESEPVPIDTLLLTEVNATTEATRVLDLYKTPRFVVEFTGTARLVELTLGQRVTLTYPRFGLDAAKEGQVIGLSIDWSNLTVKVEVII